MRSNDRVKKLDFNFSSFSASRSSIAKLLFLSIVIISFVFLLLRALGMQFFNSANYYDTSLSLSTIKESTLPQRGLFIDRNLNILAKNLIQYSLFVYKKQYSSDELNELKNLLVEFNKEIDISEVLNKIENSEYDFKLKENVSYVSLEALKNNENFNKYFYLVTQQKRAYTYPIEFSHLIGYTGKTDSTDVGKGYSQFDQIGKYKLEYSMEDSLKGIKGVEYSFDSIKNYIPAEAGYNIHLTVDSDWQVALYKIIEKYSNQYNSAGGAGVIIDNSTGQILSIVSYPGFDSNLFSTGIPTDLYQSYIEDRKLPLIDKSVSLQIAPGSTFKLISAYTLLENNIIDKNTTYFSNRCLWESNFDFCEYQKYFYGQMNVVRALYKSSNLFFCVNAMKLEQEGKLAKLFESQKSFGLGELTGVNIPGELPGNIDDPEYKKDVFNLNWYTGDTCNAVIGQGSNTVTPIQMALVAQAVENKGTVYKPNVIGKITDSYGQIVFNSKEEVLRRIEMSDDTFNLINEGMYDVVNLWDGTVYPFLNNLPGNIKAKTGTAEASEVLKDGSINNTTHGWIVGTFTYQGKSYSFANVLNLGGGGFYVAQITRDFINCLYSDFPEACK